MSSSSGYRGGDSGSDRTTLVDCVLAGNRGYNGGAVYADGHELAVRRSLFYDNDAEVYGGAILAGGSSVEISSSTLVRNVTRGWAGVIDGWGGAYQIVNSILWDNVAPEAAVFGSGGSTFAVSYSDVQPGAGFLDGGNNITAYPNFIDASALETLESLNDELASAGVELHLAAIKGPVLDELRNIGFVDELGPDRVHFSNHDALISLGFVDPTDRSDMRPAEAARLAQKP